MRPGHRQWARIVEGSFEVGGQEHFYLEGQVAAAIPQEGGDMVIHSSTQHPTEVQHKVAHALHTADERGAGRSAADGRRLWRQGKPGQRAGHRLCVAARATGRPCRMRYDRDDDMMITGKRHDLRIGYRAGVDDQGRILGLEFTHLFRCGWSQDLSLPVADRAMLHADNCYHLPHIRIESHRLQDQHPKRHRLSRLWRAAGDGGDRAGDGPCGLALGAMRWRCARPTSTARRPPPGALRPPDPQGYLGTEERGST
jgi:xanthine dehydrogenase large subunit